MEDEAAASFVRIGVQMIDAAGVERGIAAHDAVNGIAFGQQ